MFFFVCLCQDQRYAEYCGEKFPRRQPSMNIKDKRLVK